MSEATTMNAGETRGYSLAMRVIHWVMAAMMLYVVILGLLIGNGLAGGKFYDWHQAAGFILFFLVIIRLVTYRFTTPPSPLPKTISPLKQKAAHTVHFLLYASFLVQPILGWYATNAWGKDNIPLPFGYSMPVITVKNRELGNFLLEIHNYLGLLITALVIIHISAALMHQFVWKDGLIKRMIKT